MINKLSILVAVIMMAIFATTALAQELSTSPVEEPAVIGMANPASVYCCVTHDYTCEIRTQLDGDQYGMCIFPDGKECEEWSFYFGRCGRKYAEVPGIKLTGTAGARWSLISNFVRNANDNMLDVIQHLGNK